MLTPAQKKQVKDFVDGFKQLAHDYLKEKVHLEEILVNIEQKEGELNNITREERQVAAALEVLYGQSNTESKVGEKQKEIGDLRSKSEFTRGRVNELVAKLSESLRTLPIPADLENPTQEEAEITFPYLTDSHLGNETITAISSLLRKESPLTFGDVTVFEDKVSVKDSSDRPTAIQKLVKAIGEFRMQAANLSKSYEKIDDLIDRLKRSTLYVELLKTIEKNPGILTAQIAQKLGIDERKVYDNCYNLTRSNWNPPPIARNRIGGWELTTSGEILLNRFLDKCPEEKNESHELDSRQNGGVPNRNPNL